MTGMKSKFRSKFRFWLYSVPATGRNFSGILNLVSQSIKIKKKKDQQQSNPRKDNKAEQSKQKGKNATPKAPIKAATIHPKATKIKAQ
jgi:hypothetical protein